MIDTSQLTVYFNNQLLVSQCREELSQKDPEELKELGLQTSDLIPSEKPIGLFYKIVNNSSDTIGYLFGSIHKWLLKWEKLDDKISSKLDKVTTIYLETNLQEIPLPFVSVDLEISNISDSKKHCYLEKPEKQLKILIKLESYLEDVQREINSDAKSFQDIEKDWASGNETCCKSVFESTWKKSLEIDQEKPFLQMHTTRNKIWFSDVFEPQLLKASKQNKFFACVGYFHLFDTGSSRSGLKSLFEDKGFTLVQVCESKD